MTERQVQNLRFSDAQEDPLDLQSYGEHICVGRRKFSLEKDAFARL